MTKTTEWMVRVAAGIVIAWFAWQLTAASILSQVNLQLQNKALVDELTRIKAAAGQSHAPAQ